MTVRNLSQDSLNSLHQFSQPSDTLMVEMIKQNTGGQCWAMSTVGISQESPVTPQGESQEVCWNCRFRNFTQNLMSQDLRKESKDALAATIPLGSEPEKPGIADDTVARKV